MTITITASVKFIIGAQTYAAGESYAVADNVAHHAIRRGWATGNGAVGNKSVTMIRSWREGSTLYAADQTYTIDHPLADAMIAYGVAEAAALPDWVPAEGTFADIGLNTLTDVKPTGWPSGDVAGPFANWSGAAYAPDFSTLGAFVLYGSGHLALASDPYWSGVWPFDLDTLEFVGRNIPAEPLSDDTGYDSSGESTDAATLGHPNTPHTYDGLFYQSTANGGGTQGSLGTCFFPGASYDNSIHVFDLSSETDPPTRVIDNLLMEGSNGSYPATAVDEARGGFWIITNNGAGPCKFVRFSDWSVTTYTGIDFGAYGDQSLVYVPATANNDECLVALGRDGSGGVNMSVRVCPIVDDEPQGFTLVSPTGTHPSDARCGGVWSTLLECIVCYEAAGSFDVHKLAVPSDLTGGTWAWTTETLTGAGGAVPSRNGVLDNGAWGRFIEVPAARCFLWCDSVDDVVQAWRPQGM